MQSHAGRLQRFLSGTSGTWLWVLVIVGLVAILAGRAGSDTDWDLRNYHLYNAHALINGRFWTDIAAAQSQTFFSPLTDIALGAIRDRLNTSPVLRDVVLSIPHGVATALAFLLTLRVLPGDLPGRAPLALVATLFSATGAAGFPTLATAMDDMLPGTCILGGLLLLTNDGVATRTSAALAGALFGIAAGLKLTAAPYCVAAAVALLVTRGRSRPLPTVACFVLAGIGAAALVGGPWWWLLYRNFGNPMLPFMNQVFRSPYVASLPFTDDRFLPRGAVMALAYPFYWASRARTFVSELPMRDPRFAIAYVAVVVCVVHALRRSPNRDACCRAGALLVVFFVVAFALWEMAFSILRFLATLELLCGSVVLVALHPLISRYGMRLPAVVGFVALCATTQAATVYPNWGHMHDKLPMQVRVPVLEANALVVLLDPSPMAYLADFLPTSVRLLGANNNMIHPGDSGLLARQVAETLRAHAGPLYGLEDPVESPSAADRTLGYFRLRRAGCSSIQSNIDSNAIRLCRLSP